MPIPDEKFVKKIEKGKGLKELRGKAKDYLEDEFKNEIEDLSEEGKKKFTYTFYFDWKNDNNPEYMFLIQNPGKIKKWHLDIEGIKKALKSDKTYHETIKIYRTYLNKWLLEDNKKFQKNFFQLLNSKGLIHNKKKYFDYDSKTIKEEFFKKFYVTDLVKYRVKTEDIEDKVDGNADVSYKKFLRSEIDWFKPKIIFLFGSRCWKILERHRDLKLITSNQIRNRKNITDVHGHVFEYEFGYVIPLAHFSGQNQFLRSSYINYLEKELEREEIKDFLNDL